MEPKKIALLVGALVVALVTALLARSMFTREAAPQAVATVLAPAPSGPKVLVATKSLPVGTILDETAFKYQPWPKDLIQNAYYIDGKSNAGELRGSVVRTAISAGQPVTLGSVVQPGDRGFLAAALGPGMRAITVAVSASTGVAGFVFPGDRVDLMLTQSVEGNGGPALRTSETIVRNLRVLATDQRTVPEDDKGKKEVKQFGTVTLEATPRIAEKIAVAQTIGQLTLSLRPLADNASELESAIASGQVKVPDGTDPNAEKRMLLEVATRPQDSATTFVTGADVSRFQRSSVPKVVTGGNGGMSGGNTNSEATPSSSKGPVVRVARGNSVTEVPVGRK